MCADSRSSIGLTVSGHTHADDLARCMRILCAVPERTEDRAAGGRDFETKVSRMKSELCTCAQNIHGRPGDMLTSAAVLAFASCSSETGD